MGAAPVDRLRDEMKRAGLDFYLVPSRDPHGGEYVPACWQRCRHVSGFTGSAGDLLVGRRGAWLWTDARYWLQAERELDSAAIELMRDRAPGVDDLPSWMAGRVGGGRVGVDPRVLSLRDSRRLREKIEAGDGHLEPVAENLVDAVWAERPPLPANPAVPLDERFTGLSVTAKLEQVRDALIREDCGALLVTTLDAVAWVFNLRGTDVPFNPIVIGHGLIERDGAAIFTAPERLGPEARAQLDAAGVRTEPYPAFGAALEALKGRVWVDPERTSLWAADLLRQGGVSMHEAASPIAGLKARKNATERAGMRAAHRRDGTALVRFLCWLEGAWRDSDLDELSAARRLDALRREGEHFRDLSFPSISGYGPNGAIVHYSVTRDSARPIADDALYLIDSGAQYLDGTTDVTRTLHLGDPRPVEREHYTAVLRGHLALRHTVFPAGTTGVQLDAIARRPIWEVGQDYGHGTGHGVGCYLNVHEHPPVISPRATGESLAPDMVVSNEPGVYLEGQYGIRIENLLVVVEVPDREAGTFYGFEDLTLAPYCRRLIDLDSLTSVERKAIDAYHARVRAELTPLLPEDAAAWLVRETAPL